MRSKVLGLAAAAVAAGALALVPSTPAQAVGGIDGGNISGSGDVPNSVDVAAFGSGDAIAAWARLVPGGTKVYAAIATNGVWAAPKAVTAAAVTNAHDVQAVANDAGDLAVVWNQTVLGEEKVRGARYLPNGTWDGSALLSPATGIETVTDIDAGIDSAGRVHVAYHSENQGADRTRATIWGKGSSPAFHDFGHHAFRPSIDVNPAGAALLSYYSSSDGGLIMVSRRTASAGWSAPKPVAWPGTVSILNSDSVAAIAHDGRGAVMFGGVDDGTLRAVVAKVSATGSLGAANPLSATDAPANRRQLAISPNGTLQASWSTFENNKYVIRQATAAPNGGFGTSGIADPGTTTYQAHVGLVSDRRVQAVVHNDAATLTLRHRTNPILNFGEHPAGPTDGAFDADMDRNGDVVTVGVVENGFNSYVEGEWLDLSGPVSTVTAPGAQVISKVFDVKWSAVDALAGTKSSDVIASSSAWNSAAFTPAAVVGDDLTSGSLKVDALLGRTYCYEVQAVDKFDNLGQRSAKRCTTVPLDDKALAGSGWNRQTKYGQFRSTWTTTSTKGRILTRTGIKAKRLALVANRVSNGGVVEVRWNGTLVRKISLKGTAATKKVYPIATWATVRSGTLQIKVVSSGRAVRIDGLVVAK